MNERILVLITPSSNSSPDVTDGHPKNKNTCWDKDSGKDCTENTKRVMPMFFFHGSCIPASQQPLAKNAIRAVSTPFTCPNFLGKWASISMIFEEFLGKVRVLLLAFVWCVQRGLWNITLSRSAPLLVLVTSTAVVGREPESSHQEANEIDFINPFNTPVKMCSPQCENHTVKKGHKVCLFRQFQA